ncbi:UNVERIFIED_CONTAM: hypothetical protein RMT77_014229 [Armadillidium vulgare]
MGDSSIESENNNKNFTNNNNNDKKSKKERPKLLSSKSLLNIPSWTLNTLIDPKPSEKVPKKPQTKSNLQRKKKFSLSTLNVFETNQKSDEKGFSLSTFSIFETNRKSDVTDIDNTERKTQFQKSKSFSTNYLDVLNDVDDSMFDEVFNEDEDETESSEDIVPPLSQTNFKKLPVTDISDDSSSDIQTSSDVTDNDVYTARKHGLKHLSRSTPTMSPSGSPPHSDSEGQSHVSRRTKKFLRRFRNVAATERVINYYACAIVSDILWQGTLYITDNYFAFYSNIFGYVNRTLIPINDVSSIRKERTAKFIPNAVGLHTIDGKTIVFSSLISRDATYKFMTRIWKKTRKMDDSDKDINLQVPEEHFLNDSASNSGDSALEDNVDYNEEEIYYPSSLPKTGCLSPTNHVADKVEFGGVETSVTNSENDSSYTTPETGVSTSSFMEVQSSVDALGTSTSENEVRVIRRGNVHLKPIQSTSKVEYEGKKVEWSVSTAVMENAVHMGSAPFRAVKIGLQEITYMPNNSAILIISSCVIFFLLLSAIFMIYRVETLNSQLNADSNQHGDLYEEVLKMQQKLHVATTKEISKTLNNQISQLVTVRQSLEALIFLLDADHANQPPHVSEHSYS